MNVILRRRFRLFNVNSLGEISVVPKLSISLWLIEDLRMPPRKIRNEKLLFIVELWRRAFYFWMLQFIADYRCVWTQTVPTFDAVIRFKYFIANWEQYLYINWSSTHKN